MLVSDDVEKMAFFMHDLLLRESTLEWIVTGSTNLPTYGVSQILLVMVVI